MAEQEFDKFAAEQAEREAREGRDPHHVLNNPASDPQPDEWPDPYDRRPDPRAPYGEGEAPSAPEFGAVSTSEPHPDQDIQAVPDEASERDRLDR